MKFKPRQETPNVAAMMQTARQAEASGRIPEAQAICRQVLQRQPHNVDAVLLLANIEAGSGRPSTAIPLLQGLISRSPDCTEAMLQLAELLRNNLDVEGAMKLCRRAIDVNPLDAHAHYVLGVCEIDNWFIPEAIGSLERSIVLNPHFGPAHERYGFVLSLQGRMDESITAFGRAIELAPHSMSSYANFGKLLKEIGKTAEAELLDTQAEKAAGESAVLWMILGHAYQAAGDPMLAEKALVRAIQLAPAAEMPQVLLSEVLQEKGQFDEAKRLLGATLTRHRNSARLYLDIAFCGRISDNERDFVDSVAKQLQQPRLSPEARLQLHFALGKSLDDLGEYAEAMVHFVEANRLGQKTSDEVKKAHSKLIDTLIATFTPDFFKEHQGQGSDSDEPTFVVGMVRSGTTLTEQMLSNHPNVAAIGELSYLPKAGRKLIDPIVHLEKENVGNLAQDYLRLIRSLTHGEPRIIDKLPDNYVYAGLIHVAFPNSRIIHCRRNPIDNCLSIFVTPLAAAFAYSISDIAFAYREYRRLMEHWRTVLPADRFLESDYEELIASPEAVMRKMIDFLALPWDDAVLRHETNAKTPMTPSRWQVRQPLYRTSVERWRRYEPWIGELIEELSK